MSDKDMLNTKGLVTVNEHKKVGWILIKIENWDNKNEKRQS